MLYSVARPTDRTITLQVLPRINWDIGIADTLVLGCWRRRGCGRDSDSKAPPRGDRTNAASVDFVLRAS